MEAASREDIEYLVRTATLAFYDETTKAELESSVQVDYLTQENNGHKVMVFAPSHEFEMERPLWAEIDDLVIDLEPENVGLASYHVHVKISQKDYRDGGSVLSPWPF